MSTMTEGLPLAQETEVTAKAQRRRFSGAEKLRVLREADRCTKPDELSALLRREGLHSSHLSTWRAARTRGELAGLTPRLQILRHWTLVRGTTTRRIAHEEKQLVRFNAGADADADGSADTPE